MYTLYIHDRNSKEVVLVETLNSLEEINTVLKQHHIRMTILHMQDEEAAAFEAVKEIPCIGIAYKIQ